MVATVSVTTGFVVIVKSRKSLPPGTVTEAGTMAAGSLLDNATTAPAGSAGQLRKTVPVVLTPPLTESGSMNRSVGTIGSTVNVALTE